MGVARMVVAGTTMVARTVVVKATPTSSKSRGVARTMVARMVEARMVEEKVRTKISGTHSREDLGLPLTPVCWALTRPCGNAHLPLRRCCGRLCLLPEWT